MNKPNRASGTAVALIAMLTLASCSGAPETQPVPSGSTPAQDLGSPATVAENLDAPWSITFYEQTPLLSERDTARIVELDDQGTAREITVIDDVAPRGEGGLLGIAVHEDYLYAYYTSDTDNRIVRYSVQGDPGSITLGTAETILTDIPAASYHNGGRMAFGPDGMLYATAGDAGTTSSAQDLASLSGKILRMTPEGAIPDDNPFGKSLVYSYGHRNPQGIGWDEHGTMYSSEFGQNTWDELNVIEAGGNYGWPEVEGIAENSDYIDPVQQWEPAVASPSGIAVTEESIFIANLRGARLIEVPLDDLGSSTEHLVEEQGRLRDVTIAPEGTLWVLTNNTDGRGDPGPGDDRILRFDPAL